jgi:hypothetical protein
VKSRNASRITKEESCDVEQPNIAVILLLTDRVLIEKQQISETGVLGIQIREMGQWLYTSKPTFHR